jgi:hypothetical protein
MQSLILIHRINLEVVMSEMSFQAVQFVPRFLAVMALIASTWLMARFARYIIFRATCECRDRGGLRDKVAKILAKTSQWLIFLIMLPFMIEAAGFHASWLHTWQQLETQIFVNWPLWMVLSLIAAGIAFLVRGVPRFYIQLKGVFETSHNEAHS